MPVLETTPQDATGAAPTADTTSTVAARDPRKSLRGLDYDAQVAMLAPPSEGGPPAASPAAAPKGATGAAAEKPNPYDLPPETPEQEIDGLARESARDMALEDLGERAKEEKFELWRAGQALAELERTQMRYGHAELAKRRQELVAKQDEARDRLAKTEGDMQLLIDPGASDKAVDKVLAQHSKLPQAQSVEKAPGFEWQDLGNGKLTRSSGGPTVTTIGDTTTKKGETTKGSVEVLAGEVTRQRTVEDLKTVPKAQAPPQDKAKKKESPEDLLKDDSTYTSGTKSTTTTKVGLGGVSHTEKNAVIDGETKKESTSTASLDRGEGKLGVSHGGSTSRENADGSKSETSAKRKHGIIHGEAGDGAYAGVEGAAKKTGANGLSGTVKGGADGRYVVNIEPIPDTDPVKYQVKTTVGVSATVGTGGGYEKEGADVKGGVDVSVSAEGSAAAIYTHELTEAEAKKYLDDLKAAESGKVVGDHAELGVLATGYKKGWEEAKKVVQSARVAFDVEAAKDLPEGDGVEIDLAGAVGAGGNVSASGGGVEVGLGLEGKLSAENKLAVKKKGGKIVATCLIGSGDEYGVKGSAGFGGVSVGYGGGASEGTSTALTIALDPERKDFATLLSELEACGSQAGLLAFAERHPECVQKRVLTEKSGTKSGGSLSVGGKAAFEVGESAEREKEVTETAKGKSYKLTGSNTESGSLVVAKDSTTEKLEMTVDEEGNAYGDLSQTRKDRNIGKSLEKLGENVAKDPLAVATGGAKSDVDDVHVAGLLLGPADIAQIQSDAKSDRAWMQHATRTVHVEGWDACRAAIVAAKGDKALIAEALTKFVGTEGHDRYEVLYSLVRKPYSGAGGIAYELPDGLAPLKPEYQALVQMNPVAPIEAAVGKGDEDKAIELCESTIARMRALDAGLRAKADAFESPAAEAEMHSRIAARRNEVDRMHSRLLAKRAGLPEDAYAETDDRGLYEDLLEVVRGEKKDEQIWFGKLGELADGEAEVPVRKATQATPIVNQLRELYVRYRKDWNALERLAKAHPDFTKDKPIEGLGPDEVRMKIAFDAQKSEARGMARYGNPMTDDARNAQAAVDDQAAMRKESDKQWEELQKGRRDAETRSWEAHKANKVASSKALSDFDANVAGLRQAAMVAPGKCNGLNAKGVSIKPDAAQKYSAGFAKLNEANDYYAYAKQGLSQSVGADNAGFATANMTTTVSGLYQQTVALFQEGDRLQG